MKQAGIWTWGHGDPKRIGSVFVQHGRAVGTGDTQRVVEQLNSEEGRIWQGGRVYTPADGDAYIERLSLLYHSQAMWTTPEEVPDDRLGPEVAVGDATDI